MVKYTGDSNMTSLTFIDLFAGCGGLSLGLSKAGWQGLFAIEKSPDALQTLKHNLIDKSLVAPFNWPAWLSCQAMTTSELIEGYSLPLKKLRGKVDLIAGGPPCQGFSFAGRRNPNDPRNRLTEEYIQIVELVQPRFLLLENVKGFKAAFRQNGTDKEKVYAEVVKEKLEKLGYCVFHQMCNASRFGVPQPRARFIMIAHKKGETIKKSPFETLEEFLPEYRYSKGLHKTKDTTVKAAISDLEINGTAIMPSVDTNNFYQIHYKKRKLTAYQKLMRQDCNDNHEPNSLRLARHNDETLRKFNVILKKYPKGKSLTKAELLSLGTKKQCFTPLHPDMTSRTITTLPDDLLHYSEPRILTVRENARIQSFPDWFDFLGKYTTGGARRKEECPRYSQVGNAVPPLMAEGLGLVIKKVGGIDGY
jgi:DNA (cytosine-5)-methyltransferase 1